LQLSGISGCRISDDRILLCSLTAPLGAELRDPLQRVEVDIDQPEPAAVAVDPLDVVLGALEEIPVHRYAVGGGALQLAEGRDGRT
jgi:hypothetical protein